MKEALMTLTKNDIVAKVNDLGFTKKKATEVVESLLEIMKGALVQGDDVLVSGFGKFCIKEKRPRRGRNPATGEDLLLKERKVVTFKCSGKLREMINGNGADGSNTACPL
jgi:integration host factor subunit alpha